MAKTTTPKRPNASANAASAMKGRTYPAGKGPSKERMAVAKGTSTKKEAIADVQAKRDKASGARVQKRAAGRYEDRVSGIRTRSDKVLARNASMASKTAKMGKIGKVVSTVALTASALGLGSAVTEYQKPKAPSKAPAPTPVKGIPHVGSSGPTNPRGGAKSTKKPSTSSATPKSSSVKKSTSVTTKTTESAPATTPASSNIGDFYTRHSNPEAPSLSFTMPTPKSAKKDRQVGGLMGRKDGKWHLGRKVGKG